MSTTMNPAAEGAVAAPALSPVSSYTAAFRQRRALNWLTLGLTYAAMYMGRYNLSMANPLLSKQYGWDKTRIGAIITGALLVYGFSAMFNGPIADRIGGRRAMIVGATGAMVFNLLFGLGAYLGFLGTGEFLILYFTVCWALNMYFQSYSAVAIVKVNAGWFHVTERGVFSAIFGTMIQGGRFLIFFVGGAIVAALPWQWVFFVPAAVLGLMALATYKAVHDTPDQAGHAHLDVQDASSGDTEAVSVGYVLKKVFANPVMITIAVAEFCTGFARHGFEQWFPRYMVEVQKLPLNSSVFQKDAGAVVAAGVVGAFSAGMISDWVFKGRRPPVAFVGYALQVACLAIIWRAPSLELVSLAFVVNSFAISMVHSMLSGTASMDFGGKKAAATAAGMLDGMQYVAGSFVGVGMGFLLDRFGWGAWGPSMIGFAGVGAVLMLVLWNARPRGARPAR